MDEVSIAERRLASLRETWEYAKKHSEYYSGRLPDLPEPGEEPSRLRQVPICSAEVLRDNTEQLRCLRGIPSYTLFSGGTTGAPRMIYGSKRQLEGPLLFESAVDTRQTLKPLGLRTDGGHHGTPPWIPGEINYLQIPLRNRKNYDWMWRMLTSEHRFEGQDSRIRYAMLPLGAAKKLALMMLESGYDASALALESISTYAWYLSTPWRRIMEQTLGARVYDCYGFTEIPTALAHECEICGWFHFSHRVFWEVVAPWDEEPVNHGIGRLLVTSLWPWSQDHVLFRYDPGDLVRLGPICPLHEEQGFRPLGRLHHAQFIEDQGRLQLALSAIDVQEAIDFSPDVARVEDSRFGGISVSNDDGFPRWSAVLDKAMDVSVLRVQIEMKWSAHLYRAAWTKFSTEIRERLIERSSSLKSLLERQVLRLEIVGLNPGELADSDVIIC